jgi:hypothetical protein
VLEHHQIPTHLAVADRFFYGLTMAQLALLLLGGSGAWATWSDWPALPGGLRAALALATLLGSLALALVRPAGRSLAVWALVLLRYAALPRRSVWRPRAPVADSRPGEPPWAPLAPPLAWAPAPAAGEGRP